MQPKIIEQRKIMKVSCYKWEKYRLKDAELAKCPWGYIEINPMCQNCIWFTVGKVSAEKRALVFDREIASEDIPQLVTDWKALEAVSKAAPVDPETKREEVMEKDHGV